MAAGHLGQEVGGRRRNNQHIGLARQADVADLALVVEVEQVNEHALIGQRADGERRHEAGCSRGHDHADMVAALAQAADEVEALVGGDAAADNQEDAGHVL